MSKLKVKLNDKVMIISGKDRGKTGVVFEISKKKNALKVKGLNMIKKHVKASKKSKSSGILNYEAFLNVSNVMPLDNLTQKPVRHCKIKRDND